MFGLKEAVRTGLQSRPDGRRGEELSEGPDLTPP
jgi:hypothetical protein